MGARKRFDEDATLDAAMTLFWEKGYEATSLSDLESVTGLGKSSIYNTFHSKEALYARCLDRFFGLYGAALIERLNHPDFATAIRGFFGALLARMADGANPRGCMATMAAMEIGGGDSEPAHLVRRGLDTTQTAFAERCRRAVRDGQLDPDTDCDATGAALLLVTRGAAVLNRGDGDVTRARLAVDRLISALVST